MATTFPCPPEDRLRELLGVQHSSFEQSELIEHIGHCASCQQTLEHLAGANPDLLDAVHSASKHQGFENEAPLRQILSNIENNSTLTGRSEFRDRSTWVQSFLKPPQLKGALGRLDNFEVTQLIGQGGMGLVFKALDTSLNRYVALKILAPDLASDPVSRERFAREAKAAAAVHHKHVVTIHSVHEGNGLPYIVMEFVNGGSLQEYLDTQRPPNWQTIVRLGAEMASGLAAAHAHGLIHRDIKPSNILLQAEPAADALGTSKITDFGIARFVDESRLTVSGIIPGTPMYMSPEQALCEAVDERSDLFSLGSVLYALCTGLEPFAPGNPIAVLRQVCEASPQPIREINPEIPLWLEQIIERLHAKRPSDRFASAAEVADLLTYHLHHPNHPRSFPPAPKSKQIWTRRRLLVGSTVAAALLIGVVILAISVSGRNANEGSMRDDPGPNGVVLEATLGHEGPVRSVAFAPNGLTVATGSEDATVRIWNSVTGVFDRKTENLKEPIFSIAFAHSGKFLIGGGSNGPIFVWDFPSLKELPSLPHKSGSSRRLAFSPDDKTVAVGSSTQVVDLLDFASRTLRVTLSGPLGIIQSIAYSPHGDILAAGDANGVIRFFDTTSGVEQSEIQADSQGLRALAFSADGHLLASAGSGNKNVKIWNVDTHEQVGVLPGYDNDVLALAFSPPDGQFLASGGREGQVKIWNPSSLQHLSTVPAHTGIVQSLAFSPDSQTLASGGEDKFGQLWDVSALQAPKP